MSPEMLALLAESQPGYIFRHIPSHAAVYELHRADVSAQRHVLGGGKAFAIHKHSSHDSDMSCQNPSSVSLRITPEKV